MRPLTDNQCCEEGFAKYSKRSSGDVRAGCSLESFRDSRAAPGESRRLLEAVESLVIAPLVVAPGTRSHHHDSRVPHERLQPTISTFGAQWGEDGRLVYKLLALERGIIDFGKDEFYTAQHKPHTFTPDGMKSTQATKREERVLLVGVSLKK